MKEIIISGTGTGKSTKCFEVAKAYNGTVVYLNGVPRAETLYARFGRTIPDDFIVRHFGEIFCIENNKKYFISPASREGKVVFDFNDMENNYFKNIDTDLLLIIDDNFWCNYCDDKATSLKVLTSSKRDIILTMDHINTLLEGKLTQETISEIIACWNSTVKFK